MHKIPRFFSFVCIIWTHYVQFTSWFHLLQLQRVYGETPDVIISTKDFTFAQDPTTSEEVSTVNYEIVISDVVSVRASHHAIEIISQDLPPLQSSTTTQKGVDIGNSNTVKRSTPKQIHVIKRTPSNLLETKLSLDEMKLISRYVILCTFIIILLLWSILEWQRRRRIQTQNESQLQHILNEKSLPKLHSTLDSIFNCKIIKPSVIKWAKLRVAYLEFIANSESILHDVSSTVFDEDTICVTSSNPNSVVDLCQELEKYKFQGQFLVQKLDIIKISGALIDIQKLTQDLMLHQSKSIITRLSNCSTQMQCIQTQVHSLLQSTVQKQSLTERDYTILLNANKLWQMLDHVHIDLFENEFKKQIEDRKRQHLFDMKLQQLMESYHHHTADIMKTSNQTNRTTTTSHHDAMHIIPDSVAATTTAASAASALGKESNNTLVVNASKFTELKAAKDQLEKDIHDCLQDAVENKWTYLESVHTASQYMQSRQHTITTQYTFINEIMPHVNNFEDLVVCFQQEGAMNRSDAYTLAWQSMMQLTCTTTELKHSWERHRENIEESRRQDLQLAQDVRKRDELKYFQKLDIIRQKQEFNCQNEIAKEQRAREIFVAKETKQYLTQRAQSEWLFMNKVFKCQCFIVLLVIGIFFIDQVQYIPLFSSTCAATYSGSWFLPSSFLSSTICQVWFGTQVFISVLGVLVVYGMLLKFNMDAIGFGFILSIFAYIYRSQWKNILVRSPYAIVLPFFHYTIGYILFTDERSTWVVQGYNVRPVCIYIVYPLLSTILSIGLGTVIACDSTWLCVQKLYTVLQVQVLIF